jgi:hypothetical protein
MSQSGGVFRQKCNAALSRVNFSWNANNHNGYFSSRGKIRRLFFLARVCLRICGEGIREDKTSPQRRRATHHRDTESTEKSFLRQDLQD